MLICVACGNACLEDELYTSVVMQSECLTCDFNNSELAIIGTLLHSFEFLFIRLAPFDFQVL